MSFINIKYVITDLDGTITGKGFKMLPKTFEDLKKFHIQSGNRLTIATGRLDTMIKEYIYKLNINIPVISCNGALIREPKTWKILYKSLINNKTCLEVCKVLVKNGIDVVLYTSDFVFGQDNSERIKSIKRYNNEHKDTNFCVSYKIVDDILKCINNKNEILKILVSVKTKQESKKVIEIIKGYSDLYVTNSQFKILDITNRLVDKGTGIIKFTKVMGVTTNDVLVYGDNMNDEPMFKVAGHSVAVGNATHELKSIADEVIDTISDNGVGKHIRKLSSKQ